MNKDSYMNKTIKRMNQDLINGVSDWLVDTNANLVLAIDKEDYEQAAIIRDSIQNFIDINSEILAISTNSSLTLWQDEIRKINNNIFYEITSNLDRLKSL